MSTITITPCEPNPNAMTNRLAETSIFTIRGQAMRMTLTHSPNAARANKFGVNVERQDGEGRWGIIKSSDLATEDAARKALESAIASAAKQAE
jgi:hypothetical protein